MAPDPKKLERHALNNAFLSAIASAAGFEEAAQEYADRMMRAWALRWPAPSAATLDAAHDAPRG